MAIKVKDQDLSCFALDEENAVIRLNNENFVFDYSTLIDLVTNLAIVAAQMEALGDEGSGHPAPPSSSSRTYLN